MLDFYVSKQLQELFEFSKNTIILIEKCALVFSYGVTNSGKTYTIVGNAESPGLLPLTLGCLLDIKQAIRSGASTYNLGDRTIQLDTV